MAIGAFTRCDVCEMNPADSEYKGLPMCYDCKVHTAKVFKQQKQEIIQDDYERHCLNRVAPLSDD
jgi:hypothetical protein